MILVALLSEVIKLDELSSWRHLSKQKPDEEIL